MAQYRVNGNLHEADSLVQAQLLKSGIHTSVRRLFAFWADYECKGDFSPTDCLPIILKLRGGEVMPLLPSISIFGRAELCVAVR